MWWIFDCTAQRGIQPAESEVSYSGYIYQSASPDALPVSEGEVAFTVDAPEPVLADQPYADSYPGYWSATLPIDQQFELRISGAEMYPSVWAGTTPSSDGAWFNGALFGAEHVFTDTWLLQTLPDAQPLGEGGIVVWGAPYDAENWDCAQVRVQGLPVSCFHQADDGALEAVTEGTFDWFFAGDLEAGDVLVDSGIGGSHLYHAEPGDLVWAFWFIGEGR